MCPRVTRIGRFVDTVAVRSISAYICLAPTGGNDVRIGVGYRNGSHRTQFQLIIGNRSPVIAAVYCLKDASTGGSHVKSKRFGLYSCHRSGASATIRTNQSKFDPGERRVRLLFLCLLRRQGKAADNQGDQYEEAGRLAATVDKAVLYELI